MKWQSSLAEEEAPARLAGGEDTCCKTHPADRQQRSKGGKTGADQPFCSPNSKIIESQVVIRNESRCKPCWASLSCSGAAEGKGSQGAYLPWFFFYPRMNVFWKFNGRLDWIGLDWIVH